MLIQFLLSATLSRVHCIFIGADYSPSVSSGVESSLMVAGGRGRGHDSRRGRGRRDNGPCHCIRYRRNIH